MIEEMKTTFSLSYAYIANQAGLSYREIAQVTGLTIGNVGFHLHEAVRNLRDSLQTVLNISTQRFSADFADRVAAINRRQPSHHYRRAG